MLWVYGHYKYFTLTSRGSTLDVRFRCHILTFKVDPRCIKGYSAKLNNLNFHQLQVGENYSYLFNVRSNIHKS